MHSHNRANSAAALLPSDVHPSSSDRPVELPNGVTYASKDSQKSIQSSSCTEETFAETAAKNFYGIQYNRPLSIPPHYDLPYAGSEGLLSRSSVRYTEKLHSDGDVKNVEKGKQSGASAEEVWDV